MSTKDLLLNQSCMGFFCLRLFSVPIHANVYECFVAKEQGTIRNALSYTLFLIFKKTFSYTLYYFDYYFITLIFSQCVALRVTCAYVTLLLNTQIFCASASHLEKLSQSCK